MAKRNLVCLLVVSAVSWVCLGAGCPGPIPPPPLSVWLESSLPLAADGVLRVPLGTKVTFTAHDSGGVTPYVTNRWGVSGQIETRWDGTELNWTFNKPGDYVVEVNLVDQVMNQAQDHINVVVGGGPAPTPTPNGGSLSFIDGVTFWFGGTLNSDGSVNLGSGGRLDFNLSQVIRGGVPPFTYYLNGVQQPGSVFFWTAPTVSTTTVFQLVIRVVDSVGNWIERIVVVIIIPPTPSPTPTPTPTPTPGNLTITSVTFSPSAQPFHVGQQVTITVNYTGNSGTIHHLLATSTVVGSVMANSSGVTTFNYVWPFPANGTCYFWPDDQDSAPAMKSVNVVVQ